MSVYKRFKGEQVKRGHPDYDKGTWVAAGMVDGNRYHKSLPKAETRKDAEDAEKKIIATIDDGDFDILKDKTTYREYVENEYKTYVVNNNESWEQNKKYQLDRLLKFFGDIRLKQITRAKCEDLKSELKTDRKICQKCAKYKETCYMCSGEKPRYKAPCWKCRKRIAEMAEHRLVCQPELIETSTINRFLSTHSNILTLAVIDRKIKKNPMAHVPMLDEPSPRERILNDDESPALFAEVKKSPQLWAIVMIAVTTGWRRGRILGLQKEHLEARTQSVWVIQSKGEKPKRMPVSEVTWYVLEWLAQKVESGHLFRYERTNEPLKSFNYSWRKALAAAGIKDFRFHDMRHTTATGLWNVGLREFGIQKALGHTKMTTTQIYVNVGDEPLRDGLNANAEKYREYLLQNQELLSNRYTIFTPSEKLQ